MILLVKVLIMLTLSLSIFIVVVAVDLPEKAAIIPILSVIVMVMLLPVKTSQIKQQIEILDSKIEFIGSQGVPITIINTQNKYYVIDGNDKITANQAEIITTITYLDLNKHFIISQNNTIIINGKSYKERR